jgi:hypothetical protein
MPYGQQGHGHFLSNFIGLGGWGWNSPQNGQGSPERRRPAGQSVPAIGADLAYGQPPQRVHHCKRWDLPGEENILLRVSGGRWGRAHASHAHDPQHKRRGGGAFHNIAFPLSGRARRRSDVGARKFRVFGPENRTEIT